MDLQTQYHELADKIRKEYFPILKEKREVLKYSKRTVNSVMKEWGFDIKRQSDFSPELIFKLNDWLDEELEIKKQMETVKLQETKAKHG